MAAARARAQTDLMVELLRRSGDVSLRVNGSSMLPSIWPGDVVTVRRHLISEVRAGDVALFIRAGRLFVHRVVARRVGHLVTRGDALPSADAPVHPTELLGVVVSISRKGRAVRLFTDVRLQARLVAACVSRSSSLSKLLQRVYAIRWRARPEASRW